MAADLPTLDEAVAMVRRAASIAIQVQPPIVGKHISHRLEGVAESVEGGGAVAQLIFGQWKPMIDELIQWGGDQS